MEQVFHAPDECSGSIHVSLHYNLAGKATEGCLDCVILDILRMHFGLKIGITEVYLAAESSSGYRI